MANYQIRYEVRRDDIVSITPVAWFPNREDAEHYCNSKVRDEAYYGIIPENITQATTFRYIVQDLVEDVEWYATDYYIN